MRNKYRLFYFLCILFSILLLNGCGFMGNQPPKWQSGMFTPDGKYYVYTYGQVFVTQYNKRGGATFSSGILTNYLQIIDCAYGKKLLEKPYKSKEMINIETIEGNQVALWSYKIGESQYSPAVFDLSSLKMKFCAEDLKKLNPNVPLKNVNSYFKNTSSQPGIIFEADDGRKKIINPETGIITNISGEFERADVKSGTCYQTDRSIKGFGTTNGTRKKIKKGNARNGETLSTDDFLSPEFLTIDQDSRTNEGALTLFDNHFFIISPISTSDKKQMQLTMLDFNTLKTKWILELPQGEMESNNYNNERFSLQGNKLYIANSTNVIVIDLEKGMITANYPLFDFK